MTQHMYFLFLRRNRSTRNLFVSKDAGRQLRSSVYKEGKLPCRQVVIHMLLPVSSAITGEPLEFHTLPNNSLQ